MTSSFFLDCLPLFLDFPPCWHLFDFILSYVSCLLCIWGGDSSYYSENHVKSQKKNIKVNLRLEILQRIESVWIKCVCVCEMCNRKCMCKCGVNWQRGRPIGRYSTLEFSRCVIYRVFFWDGKVRVGMSTIAVVATAKRSYETDCP